LLKSDGASPYNGRRPTRSGFMDEDEANKFYLDEVKNIKAFKNSLVNNP